MQQMEWEKLREALHNGLKSIWMAEKISSVCRKLPFVVQQMSIGDNIR